MLTNEWRYYARLMAGVALVSIAGPAIGVGAAILLGVQNAYPHEALPTSTAPLGWSYGLECCSLKDCARSPAGDISTVDGGYRVNSTGEIIPYNDRRIKRSRDEFYHRCAMNGNFKLEKSLCLYVPDQGF
jgi:hypothetical protein